ncbi:MAG: AAA family ATPase, partial [Pseudomonadota bacterium]|nr:AAA family ATPase [Pseudomonadota bacterium]
KTWAEEMKEIDSSIYCPLNCVDDSGNVELQLAREFVEDTGCHIFLTGKAGTGKTTFLKNLKANTAKRMIVTAPTGVAAINAGGVTLHSFFQLPFGPFIPGSDGFIKNKERVFRFSREKKQIIKSLDLLVIDEISMVRADVLDAVDKVLQYHRRSNLAFGGVQLLLIGDLYQLPPVAKSGEWEMLRQYYESAYFFSSLAFKHLDLVTIELEKVYRQADDRFIHLLNKVRDNRMDESSIETLNQRVKENFTPEEGQGYITLTTHNRNADTINQEKLEAIPEDAYDLEAEISGDFPEHIYPTFSRLSLKKGVQVMFLRNDTSVEKRYYNGKIGKIKSISHQEIRVICPGETEPITVEPVEWENIKYSVNQENQEIEAETIGRFKQFPLKPAWAITIHKSQGLTFDRAVIDARAAFAQGQIYVALSRCKTFAGLVLSSPIPTRGIKMDEAIFQFINHSGKNAVSADRLLAEKMIYQQQLLSNCFDFQPLNNRLGYFFSLLSRNADLVQVSGVPDLEQIPKLAQNDIILISEKFKHQLNQHFPQNSLPAGDDYIQKRVKKASSWFQDKLGLIFADMVNNLILETDNKSLAKKIKNAFDNLSREIAVKLAGIRSCENGFSPSRYLRAVSKAESEFMPGKAKKSQAHSYSESDILHPQLFQHLKEWRLRLSKKKGVAAFQILHQRVLIQIVVRLPRNIDELKKINGVGPKTISDYGDDILGLVLAYRQKHGIKNVVLPEIKQESAQKINSTKKQAGLDTKKSSFDLFKQGFGIADIAEKRGLVENTIQGHLSHYIETGDLDIDQLLSPE